MSKRLLVPAHNRSVTAIWLGGYTDLTIWYRNHKIIDAGQASSLSTPLQLWPLKPLVHRSSPLTQLLTETFRQKAVRDSYGIGDDGERRIDCARSDKA